jgi:hypothetical protein
MKPELSGDFQKNTHTRNFMRIRPVEAEFFRADGQTDRHNEANSPFFAILLLRLKKSEPRTPKNVPKEVKVKKSDA